MLPKEMYQVTEYQTQYCTRLALPGQQTGEFTRGPDRALRATSAEKEKP